MDDLVCYIENWTDLPPVNHTFPDVPQSFGAFERMLAANQEGAKRRPAPTITGRSAFISLAKLVFALHQATLIGPRGKVSKRNVARDGSEQRDACSD